MVVTIPGLPPELAVVPPAPSSHLDPEADQKREAFRRWRYAVMVYRTERHRELRNNPDLIPFELAKCAQHPSYWSSIWLRVFEPRWRVDTSLAIPDDLDADDPDADRIVGTKRIVIPDVPRIVTHNLMQVPEREGGYDPALDPVFGYVPFIPFADQVRVENELLWTLTQSDENSDTIWSKSRGWGASWELVKIGLWGWSFSHYWPGAPPWNALFLSRKEEYVDSKQQRSLFWKARRLMRDMPSWQMPVGFNPDVHDQKGIIINPQNGNEFAGESTNTKAGRGDRATFAVLDEAAAMPNFDNIWSTLAETTDHRWACSTENFEEGTAFYDLRTGRDQEIKPYLIETEWWENPLNDAAWLARQEKRYANNPEMFQQEIWRNPYTGSTWVYPWAADIRFDPAIKPVSGYGSFIGADPGYRDPTALIAAQEAGNGDFNVLDAYQIDGKEADFFAPLLKPSLLTDAEPNWRDKEIVVWQAPIEPTLVFEYRTRELGFAATVAAMGTPKVIGDTYGEVLVGATKDSVYSRWRKYGISVNTDRKTGEAVTKSVKITRTFQGRQEAMNRLSRRWKFADTPGARMTANAWKNSKFKARPDKPVQTEPREPEHDANSHLRTAGEFVATYVQHRSAVLGRDLSKPTKTRLGGQIANMGTKRASLRPLPRLEGVAD